MPCVVAKLESFDQLSDLFIEDLNLFLEPVHVLIDFVSGWPTELIASVLLSGEDFDELLSSGWVAWVTSTNPKATTPKPWTTSPRDRPQRSRQRDAGGNPGHAGSCHNAIGRYDQHYHNQHLTLAQQIGNREGESNALED